MPKENVEYATMNLKVPKKIIAFLKDYEKTLGMTVYEYLEHTIICDVDSMLNTDDFNIHETMQDEIIEKYGLKDLLKSTRGTDTMPIEKDACMHIEIIKLDCKDACGWGIHDNKIQVEIAKPDWEALEKIAARTTRDLDFIIAESILALFTEGP